MKKALIIVDMQNDFLDGSLGNKDCLKIVPNCCRFIKKFKGDLFVTKDTHFNDYLKTKEGKKLPIIHCIRGTKGHDLNAEILESLKKKKFRIFEKYTFGSIELGKALAKEKYDEIILIGVCTDICVISNALLIKSFSPNSTIKIISSCCAGTSKKAHLNALKACEMCHIEIVS